MTNIEKGTRIPVQFYSQESGPKDPVSLPVEYFKENHPHPFTREDEQRLMNDYDELALQGYRGALQIIHQRGSSGDVIPSFMPPQWVEKHLQKLYMLNPGNSQEGIDESRDIVVVSGLDGSMSEADRRKLHNAMRERVGIFGGGGDAHPLDTQYKEELLAWESTIKTGTPIVAECLTHEIMGELLRDSFSSNEGVIGGYFEGLTSVVDLTDYGKNHPIFGRTGDRFVTMVGNEYHVEVTDPNNNDRPKGKVLGRNTATGNPVAYSIDAQQPGQITSYQYHPYHPIGVSEKRPDILIPDNKGEVFKIPNNRAHPLQAGLAEYLLGKLDYFAKYGITANHVAALFHTEITAKELGKDFYGPVFQFMADKRLGRI